MLKSIELLSPTGGCYQFAGSRVQQAEKSSLKYAQAAIIIADMKKLILSAALLVFAVAVQAGDAKPAKPASADKPACCAKMATKTEASCPMAQSECCSAAKAKQTAARKTVVKVVLLSPKAASL